jgi:oligopeptide transport system substrate-binding protein
LHLKEAAMHSTSSFRSRRLATFLALLALVFAVACAGADNAVTGSDPAPPDQQVLRLRMVGEPRTIDPHLSSIISETSLTKPLSAGLFTYNEELKVVPNLAKALPTTANGGISQDGKTYKIELVDGAKWSDGKALTAGDFTYSLKRALDPQLAGPYASFFYGLTGAREYNTALGTKAEPKAPSAAELARLRDAVGVSAENERTLVYQLKEPNPSFLNLLALWTAFPVRQDIVERYGAQWTEPGNHIGNGAFVLKDWLHDQRITFEPNPYWHGDKPVLTRIEVNFIADDVAAYAAYLNNELDVVTVPPANMREVSNPASPLNVQLSIVPELSTQALFMNNTVAPFNSSRVRQAFGKAIDRNAFVEGVLQGAAVPTTSWLPPAVPGYDAGVGKEHAFDPAGAKKLLAEAGYANGQGLPKVTFLAVANDTNRLIGQFIQDQLARNLGVQVEFDYVDSRTFGLQFTTGQFQVTLQRWVGDWPYPDNWLLDLFGTGGLNNLVKYSNSRFDELMGKAQGETDDKKRLALYGEAHKLIVDEAAVAPMYNRVFYVLVKPNVRNLIPTSIDGAIKGDYNLHKTYIARNAD